MKGTVHVGHMSKGTAQMLAWPSGMAPLVLLLCCDHQSGGASPAHRERQEPGDSAPGNNDGACHRGNASILGQPE